MKPDLWTDNIMSSHCSQYCPHILSKIIQGWRRGGWWAKQNMYHYLEGTEEMGRCLAQYTPNYLTSHDRQLIRLHSTNLFTAYINQQSACSEYAQKVVCRFAQTNINFQKIVNFQKITVTSNAVWTLTTTTSLCCRWRRFQDVCCLLRSRTALPRREFYLVHMENNRLNQLPVSAADA